MRPQFLPVSFPAMPDLSTLLAAIQARPDDESAWLALAAHYRDNGRDDEAATMRVF
jgi:hypothetical protein